MKTAKIADRFAPAEGSLDPFARALADRIVEVANRLMELAKYC